MLYRPETYRLLGALGSCGWNGAWTSRNVNVGGGAMFQAWVSFLVAGLGLGFRVIEILANPKEHYFCLFRLLWYPRQGLGVVVRSWRG